MPWWGWFVLAAALLAVELFVIDAQFYLVFLGVSAALVGLLGLADASHGRVAAVARLRGARHRDHARVPRPASTSWSASAPATSTSA